MASFTTFSLQHILPDQFENIYGSLLDFKKFGEVHPFIINVKLTTDQSPAYKEYSVREEVYFLGFIKSNPTYTARVTEIEKGKHIRYTSPVKKFIFLTVDLRFSKNENGALLVTENFEIRFNKLVAYVFSSVLKKAHLKFFENLKYKLLDHHENKKTS